MYHIAFRSNVQFSLWKGVAFVQGWRKIVGSSSKWGLYSQVVVLQSPSQKEQQHPFLAGGAFPSLQAELGQGALSKWKQLRSSRLASLMPLRLFGSFWVKAPHCIKLLLWSNLRQLCEAKKGFVAWLYLKKKKKYQKKKLDVPFNSSGMAVRLGML